MYGQEGRGKGVAAAYANPIMVRCYKLFEMEAQRTNESMGKSDFVIHLLKRYF